MDHHPPACSTHRALVARAIADDPPDDVLERYATEVAECTECRRALALHLGVHPAAIDRPDAAGTAGMAGLLRELRAPEARSRMPWLLAGTGVAAMAAVAGWLWIRFDAPAPAPAPGPAPTVAAAEDPPDEAAPAPVATPVDDRAAPQPPATHRVPEDAVAMLAADDWPPPAFEDLRGARPKDASATVRAAQLVLSGTSAVGHAMGLTVVTSTSTALAVCVEGPERGVVWRGAVDAGRTELTRDGHPLAFGFSAPGRYRFLMSAADTEISACTSPIHIVEVDVAG
jgi:hypothetical protein